MDQTYVLGKDAKVYAGGAEDELDALEELSIVQDVTVNESSEKADITTRGSGSVKREAVTWLSISLDFNILWDPSDEMFLLLRTAYETRGTVELAALTGDRDTAGSHGPKGTFNIDTFTRNEPLTGVITAKITASVNAFDEFVDVTEGT